MRGRKIKSQKQVFYQKVITGTVVGFLLLIASLLVYVESRKPADIGERCVVTSGILCDDLGKQLILSLFERPLVSPWAAKFLIPILLFAAISTLTYTIYWGTENSNMLEGKEP